MAEKPIDTREVLYRWGIITLAEWIPESKYTPEDCVDWEPPIEFGGNDDEQA